MHPVNTSGTNAIMVSSVEEPAGTAYLLEAHKGCNNVFGRVCTAYPTSGTWSDWSNYVDIRVPADVTSFTKIWSNVMRVSGSTTTTIAKYPTHGSTDLPAVNTLMHDGHVELSRRLGLENNNYSLLRYKKR
jgi:prepilin-type processing-associated H-X9-DG protein